MKNKQIKQSIFGVPVAFLNMSETQHQFLNAFFFIKYSKRNNALTFTIRQRLDNKVRILQFQRFCSE